MLFNISHYNTGGRPVMYRIGLAVFHGKRYGTRKTQGYGTGTV